MAQASRERDDIRLPTADEREWVVAELAELVARGGYEHLVLAPLLTAEDRFFPDRWSGTAGSLEHLIRRLLVYADLDFELALQVHEDDDVGGGITPAGIGAPLWLVRVQANVLHVAARKSTLRDPAHAVPAAARIVAEAWRARHRLSDPHPIEEQRKVDLCTVYLGFGVLTTDAAVRHSTTETANLRLRASTTRLGMLSPQVMAYALALVLAARHAPQKEVKGIARRLQANQSAFLRAAWERIGRTQPPVVDALGLPPREAWAEPPSLEDLTVPFGDEDAEALRGEAEVAREDRGVLGVNEGRPVFRVERSKALRLARMFGLPILLLGMLAGQMPRLGIELPTWQLAPAAAVLALVGLVVGRFLPDARCSEPKCGTPLSREMTHCPRCRGRIAGVIRHPRERLAAEEALKGTLDAEETQPS